MLYILPELEMYTGTMWYQSIILKHKQGEMLELHLFRYYYSIVYLRCIDHVVTILIYRQEY